jgi:hypothetical protein
MAETETLFIDVESFRVVVEIDSEGKVENTECSCDEEEVDMVENVGPFGPASLTDICMHQKAALKEVYSQIEHDFNVEAHF